MKGSLRIVRVCESSSKTNFDNWSDPKYKLPPKSETKSLVGDSLHLIQPDGSDNSLKSIISLNSSEINEIRSKIRQGNPLLSKKEIRNIRLPFHESLLQNLREDGFLLTYEFIKDLISVDEIFHKDLKTNSNLTDRPILKFNKTVLIPLSTLLMRAESAKRNGEKSQEATAFLDLAVLFGNFDDKSWNWVAQEMFEQCMEIVDGDCIDLRLKATAKYLYALFLFDEVHNLIEAKTQVECAISISDSKYWTVKYSKEDKEENKDDKKSTLYFESCILLHKIFLEMAQKEMISQNSEEAIKLCRNSLLLAKMIDSKFGEANALKKLIDIYLSLQQVYSVPELLESYMKLCTDLRDFESLCEGYIQYARYHDCIGEKANVIMDMKKLLQTAEKYKIKKMVAKAHHKLALYCFSGVANTDLLEHAIEAYMCYMDLKSNRKEIEEARCLVGIAQAREILSDYTSLVSESNNKNPIELSILIRWKNLRIPFFDNKIMFIPELMSSGELLDRVENSRFNEFLMNASSRRVGMSNLSSKLSSYQLSITSLNSKGESSTYHTSMINRSLNSFDDYKPGGTKSNPSIMKLNKNVSIPYVNQESNDDDENKIRTVGFTQNSPHSNTVQEK